MKFPDYPEGFGPIVCKKHPEREAVPPMALRWCEECKRDAEARYADPKVNVTPGIEYERERAGAFRTAGGGAEVVYAHQEKSK